MGPTVAQGYGSQFMALAHPGVPFTVANVGGSYYRVRDLTVDSRVDVWLRHHPFSNILIDDGGGNELGVADSQAVASLEHLREIKRNYCAARRRAGAQKIVGVTHTPGINQPDTEFWFEADELAAMDAYNAAMRRDCRSFGYDTFVDLAAVPELQDPTNVTYFYDGVHYTAAGAALAAQKFVEAGI